MRRARDINYKIRSDHDGTGIRAFQSQVDRATSKAKKQFAGVASAMRAGLVGAVAGGALASVANPFSGAADAIEHLDAVAKRARTSGVSAGFYQTLVVAANEASVAQGVLDSSLTAFSKRVGEARAGTGALATTLAKIDQPLADMLARTTSQEQAFRLVADRMAGYESQTQRNAVAAALFSRAGVDLTRILGEGSQVFDDTRAKAERLGLIIEGDLLDRAERLQNEYGLVTQVMDLQFKAAMVEIAPIMVRFGSGVAGIAKEFRTLAASVSEFVSDPAFQQVDEWFKKYGPMGENGGAAGAAGRATNEFLRRKAEDARAYLNQVAPESLGGSGFAGTVVARTTKSDVGQFSVAQQTSNSAAKTDLGVSRLLSGGGGGGATGGGAGAIPIPQPAPFKLPELEAQMLSYGAAVSETTGAMSDLRDVSTSWTDQVSNAFGGIGSQILAITRGTQTLGNVLTSVLDRLASSALDSGFQMMLQAGLGAFGGGGFGGAAASIIPRGFAGFFAKGGVLGAGQWGFAGEAGVEPVVGPAKILPAGGGGSVNYQPVITLQVNGDPDVRTLAHMRAMLQASQAEARAAFPRVFAEARSRGGI
jgi:hypothetical protein